MKKYIFLALLATILFLGGCGTTTDNTKNNQATDVPTEEEVIAEAEKAEKEAKAETEEESGDDEKGESKEPAEKEEGYSLEYNADAQSVQLVKPDGTTEILAERSASEPVISPDGTKAAYVSSIEWEELSDVFIIDLEEGTQKSLITSENGQKPKKVIWENDENVLVLIGQAYGTVGVGGNIYRLHLETKEITPLTHYEDEIQITDFVIDNGKLKYSGIKYIDDILNESVEYANERSL